MRRHTIRTVPTPGQLWLSSPPYVLIAKILDVDARRDPGVVRYELYDDNGCALEEVSASLDEGWWQAFQPLTRRCG
jgi:hypothetical protein